MAIDEPLSDPVLQVKQERKDSNRDSKNFIGEFGAKAENIQITIEDNSTNPATIIEQCSLLDFFKNWEDFKTNNAFMYYGEAKDLENQVKFWYGDNGYKITIQPVDCYINALGESFSFSVKTNSPEVPDPDNENRPYPKYQWQFSTDNGKTWADSNLQGEKTATLGSISATLGRINRLYRCKIIFPNKTVVYSNPVQIILSEQTI